MRNRNQSGYRLYFLRLVGAYFFLLFLWFILYLLFGDGLGFLGLVNALAVYFFLPVPLIVLFSLFDKSKKLWLPSIGAILIIVYLWGPLFSNSPPSATAGPRLRVMTFNVLGRAGSHEAILDSILAEKADLLFVQEITPELASIFSDQLTDEFPYQILQPAPRSSGLGVLSRYPLKQLDVVLPGNWMGSPQILEMEWQGTAITLVNFHTLPTGRIWPAWVMRTFELRDADLRSLAEFAADEANSDALIVAGDANVTRLNDSYKSLTAVLEDAWAQAGFGLGHSFPGPVEPSSNYAKVSFFRVPFWLVGIDYIFYSQALQANRAWMAQFYGGSDHRGVVTELIFSPSSE